MNSLVRDMMVPVTASLRDATRAIERGLTNTAFVVDDAGRLVGLVTDGDVRRAVLKDLSLDISVRTVMNTNPMTVSGGWDPAELYRTMLARHILCVPILEADRTVVDFIHLPALAETVEAAGGAAPEVLQERRVLVIGGAGYIGSALVRELLAHGHPVRVFDSLMYGEASLAGLEGRAGFELIRGDTRNVEEIAAAIKGVSAVVHLGEIVGDPACQLNPDFTIDVNYLATRRIAEACRHMKIARFVFISSCSVYGAGDGLLDEKSPLAPVSLYAKCKIEAERALLSMVGDGFHPTIFRLATVFGLSYRPRFDLVVNLLAARAVARGKIKIIGGAQWRPFVHVRDVGDVILQALGTPVDAIGGQIFNVGDDALNFQIRDLADFIRRAIPDVAIETENGSNDARDYRVSFAKLRGALGPRRWRTIDEGIAEIKAAIEGGQVADYAERQYSNYLNFVGPE